MPNTHDEGNGWNEYQKLVLSKLDELTQRVDNIKDEQVQHKVELALIKQKASIWGATTGCISALLMMAVAYIRSKI